MLLETCFYVHLHEMRTSRFYFTWTVTLPVTFKIHLTMIIIISTTAVWKDRATNKWRPAPYILKAPSSHTCVF